jgi:hypothetical protein
MSSILDGMKVAALNKVIEEGRMCLQPAMDDTFDQVFQLAPFRAREQRNARPFDRGVAYLRNF